MFIFTNEVYKLHNFKTVSKQVEKDSAKNEKKRVDSTRSTIVCFLKTLKKFSKE